MKNLKVATTIIIGVTANSYLQAYGHPQSYSTSRLPGIIEYLMRYDPDVIPDINNPPSFETPIPFNLQPADLMNKLPAAPVAITIATILKIALKLLIFKMIVKMMAVICFLLYLPKFDTMTTTDFTTPMMTTTLKPTPTKPKPTEPMVAEMMTTTPMPADDSADSYNSFMEDSNESGYYYRVMKAISTEPTQCDANDWSCRLQKSINARSYLLKKEISMKFIWTFYKTQLVGSSGLGMKRPTMLHEYQTIQDTKSAMIRNCPRKEECRKN